MSDPEDELRLSEEAGRVLSSRAVTEAFRRAEVGYVAEWQSASTVEEREKAHAKLGALTELKRQLQGMSDNALIVRNRAEQQRRSQRAQRVQ